MVKNKDIFSIRKFKTGTHSALIGKLGVVAATALAIGLSGATASADEVTTVSTTPVVEVVNPNPATNLETVQEAPTAEAVATETQAGTQSGELVSPVTSPELDAAVTSAQEAGVSVTEETTPVAHESLDAAQADLANQTAEVIAAEEKQVENTTEIKEAEATNADIDRQNQAEAERVAEFNQHGQEAVDQRNAAGQAAVDARNAAGQAAVDTRNQKELDDRAAEAAAVEQRNKDGQAAADQRNAAGQAAVDARNVAGQAAVDARNTAGQAAVDQRNAAGQAAVDQRNAAGQAAADARNAAGQAAVDARNQQEQANRDAEAAAVAQRNKDGQAAVDQRNADGQAQVDSYNQTETARVDALNAGLKAEYDAAVAEVAKVEAINAEIRKRNAQAASAAEATNAQLLAEYEAKKAEMQAKTKEEGYLSEVVNQALIYKSEPDAVVTVSGDAIPISASDFKAGYKIFLDAIGANEATSTVYPSNLTNVFDAFNRVVSSQRGDDNVVSSATGGLGFNTPSKTFQVFKLSKNGKATITYTNLENSTFNGRLLSKVELEISADPSSHNLSDWGILAVTNDPAQGLEFNFI